MRKVDNDTTPAARIRRRDTAAVAVMGSIVLLVLSLAGALGLIEALVGSAAIFAVSTFYYLSVSVALNPQAVTSVPVSKPEPANDPVADDLLLAKLPLPVVVVGPGGRIESANPAARDFLGLAEGRGHLSAALRQPSVLEAVTSALQGESPAPVEYSSLAPVESHVRAIAAPIPVEDGGAFPWRAMLVLFDETSVKRTERMRADFLANASHELRTPLASLSGFIETLRGHAKDDPVAQDRFLTIMYDQTERMRRLINDLLSLSRVEMDEHVPPSDRVDFRAVTEDVIAFLKPQLEEKAMTLAVEMDETAIAIGDRDQLTEVVQNLIENAIKYSEPSTTITVGMRGSVSLEEAERPRRGYGDDAPRMTLSAPPNDPEARFVVLRVTDQGKGISRGDLPRLSERFFRVGGQKSGPKEGTGLGLAIVKHIISRHRGGFAVESQPGEGSIFSAFFPASNPDMSDSG